jgi:hypothetical protein
MVGDHEVEERDEAVAPEPAGDELAPSPGDTDEGEWVDEERQRRNVLIAQIALVVVVLVGVVVVLALKSDDDAGPQTAEAAGEQAGDDGGGQGGAGNAEDGQGAAPADAKPGWPNAIIGRPKSLGVRDQPASEVEPEAEPGIYVWSDFDGWHAWVIGGEGVPPIVTGTLTANDSFAKATPVDPSSRVEVKDKLITFTFTTDAKIAGMDFNTGFYAKRLVFTFNGPDGPIDAAVVRTGSQGAPGGFPLVIEKS